VNINATNTPVFMVHGWAGSHLETWRKPGLEQLLVDQGRTVVGVDLLGHGTNLKPHDPHEYGDIPNPIREQLTKFETPVDAVGFSLGAIALLQLARHQPDCFRRLMLVGVGNGLLEPDDETETARIVSGIDGLAPTNDIVARQFGTYARSGDNDPRALRAILLRPRAEQFKVEELQNIGAEVRLVVGDKDFVQPVERLAGCFKNCRTTILKNCDHFATLDHFGFIDAMLEFFAKPR